MNVAIDATSVTATPSGVGRYIVELVRHLAAVGGARPIVIGQDLAAWNEIAGLARIPTRKLAGSTPARVRRAFFESVRLPGLLRAAQADVFHAAAMRAPYRRLRVPVVTSIYDLGAFVIPGAQGGFRTANLRAHVRRAARSAARIMTLSQAVAGEIVERFPEAGPKVRVIYLGVSAPFRGGEPSPPEAPTFVSVATLERRKNLTRLLEAFAAVSRRLPPARLRLFGQPDNDAERVRARIRELALDRSVTVEGYVPDEVVAAAYRGATAVVYPSLYEGFGLPILEAMAAGAPVITSDRGAMREIAGDGAVLVDPESPESIATAMIRVAESRELRDDLCGRGRERAAGFSWERCAREHVELYREAASAAS